MATVNKKSKGKNIESIYPLSPMQQGMLFHTLYAPETGVYFQQLSCALQGYLNIEAFEQAWQRVVERHSVLRTAFMWENPKQSFQVVCKLVNIPWVHHDWRSLSANEQQDALEAFLQADRDQGFELKQVPLMRCTLIRVADNTYKFIWSHHHLLIDGWSLPTIVQEVFAFYDAFNKGENLHLKAPRPYEDYITWLKKQDDFQAELYWQETLKGFTAPTPLTVEIPLTKRQQQSNYNSQQIKITEIAQMQTFAKQHKLTLNNLIQGAWALLLSRYSGETDVVFGATVSGRPPDLLGVESMVGLFINTLPVRITIPEDVEVLAWLKNLQAQQVESEQYSYSPLVEIQGKSEIPRGMPLFESIVVFENYPVDASVQEKIANLDISDIRCIEQTNYLLTVLAVPGSELSISISYDTSRFEAATITRMLRHLQTLLTGIVTQPNQCVWELPLLTESEQNQLLQEYQNTETTYLQDKCIHELFELQVEQTPNAIAVVFENQQLTYEQLNTRANQLAHYLRTLGVGADTLVGICIERSLEMIVGILGILKAGGAYVPLDPNYPQERLSFTLSDSQVKVLLTQQQLLPNLPSHQAQVLCIDADWELVAQQNQQNLPIITTPANLAYIIYTSGSTGKPKGVLINHANVVRLFTATEKWFHFNQQHVWTLFHSYAFDFSVWEIWGALIKGARLVIVPYWISRSPKDFYQLLSTQKVTVLNQTPSAFRQLIQAEELIDAPANLALRWVIFGGEALELQSLKPWFERHTDKSPQLVNMYGITETTVHVTYRPITIADLSSNAGSVIGSPISDLQVYVLDKKRQLLPIGVPGEMYVGGAGLARGYFNRQELTSNVFVVHPFNKDPNARLYKTGDLARYLSNDDLEYLGRIDNQVKIRGFRIELGEIEAAISQHPNIQATVVVAREDTPGDKRLVAYLVLHQQQAVSVNDLRQFLSAKLPQYMIPSAFVFLETLPLTSNGKVDRRALPAPELRRELEVSFVAARTPNEQMLATIWAEVLRVEQVGIYDNFFELGGDSILSLQIIARANQAGLQLSPKQLFEHQAIVQLATVVSTAKKIQAQQGLATGQLPLTPIQQWFFEQNQPEPHHYNQSVLLEVPSDLKPELLKRVLQQLLLHHDALRLQFMLKDKGWQAVNADFAEAVSLNVVDLSTISQKEQLAALEIVGGELQASLNLSTGPIMGAALFQLGTDQSSRLLLVIHHLSVDSVSWRILLNDLQTAYQQLSRSEVMQLPTKTTSFKYWAQRLSEYAQSEALTGELAYWLNSSQKPVLPIPVDHEQGKNIVISASMVSVSLNATQTQALLQEVPRAYNTQINDVLLTALVQVLSKWAGSNLVRLNLEGHGREDIFDDVDLSRTVGWFTTIFPVLLDVEASDNLGTILKSVKEQLRRIPHKGIGYGVLRYLHQNEEITNQLQTSLPAQISFNYLGQFDQALDTSAGFKLANEPVGASQSWQSGRVHLLEIGGFISQGQLQIDWTYSSNIHQKSTIENLANGFIQALQALIAHCLSPENGGYTPSDFPLAKLTQTQLDAELGKTNWQNVADIYPLSPMQQGMLFHSLYAPESGVYFTQLSWTLTGNLNVPAFEQAWQQVVARHTILRTAFIWESLSQPLQIVYEKVNITIQTDDWRKLSAQQQQQQLEVFVESERQQSFQLSQAPLMRLHLLQLDRNTYQFIWSHHHLLLDGWSLPLVFQDLLDLYQAICQSKSLPLQRTISYRNYIAWLQQQNIAQAKEFWQQKLQGFSVPTPLTVDKPLSNREQDSSYSEQQIQLTVAVTTAVESFARQHQLTLNNLVQASWALLLSRYSQETDVVFGATVSGRPPTLSGVESMVGLFINTLPVRVQISEKTQLLDLLKDLQTQQIESEQFSYSSLVDIQGLSDVPRGRSLFESIVVFENYPVDRAVSQDDNNLSISHVRGIEQTNYPLTFVAVPGKQLFLKVSYDTSRFEDGTISRMLGHLVTLLSAIVANPQERISQLPLLTATEQQQVIVEWNDTEVEYPQEQCIHQLFEKQVELNPQAVAVVFEDQQLTYQELNQRANQLGHHLRTLGVKPDVFVGICVERSLSMVVGLLGILKAGGAYVPLDPDYPQERLAYMLKDAQVSVLLTQQKLVEQLPQHQAKLVCLDNDWNLINQGSQDNFRSGVQLSNLAYVIYTSGSTGQPKGVMNTHAGISNRLFWMQDTYKLTPTDCVLQKTPFSFDVSVWEFFWPLLNGIRLVIAQPGGHQDSNYLINLIAAQKITTVHFVPSMLQVFLQEQELKACKSLRQVICSGEALPFELQKRFFTGLDAELHNLYGPTEAAIDVTFWQCERNSNQQIVPIGRPIANTQIYVLDRYLQPMPVCVTGELHIGGAGLARGYLNRPELTAEKFIRNPWSQDPDSRLYKTGDLARYLPNGNIEYLGRIDYQVKIRGFRIELGEIEASLSQHPDVLSVVVIAREDIPGDKRLIAYLVVNQQLTPNISQLRQFLMQKLPEYMIPSAFVYLDSLPLTPNGKVDRRNLPAPEFNRQLEVGYVAPRNPVEEMLAQIWADVLRVEQVGIHDNFFELGGDSILSIQIISRAKLAGVQLTVKQLFANQKIAQLSTVVGTTLALQIEQELVTGTLPLTPIQHWFFEQDLPEKHHFNQSLLLSVPSDIKPEILEQAWQQLLVHHDALRLRFKQTDLTWQQMHAAPTGVVFSFFNISTLREPELQAAIETTANTLQASLNLSENLVQVGFFFLGIDKEARLLIVIHHLVVDGVSWRILLEDLQTAYEQISQGKAIKLPPKTTSFKDWAQKLREYAQSEVLKSELGYWLSASESWVSPLPRLRQGVNSVASARTISVSLNQTETQALLQYVPKAYKTQINDVLLTALVLVVSRWTNSSSVIFNLEGHGREEIVDGVDLSRTIGWFTTIFPVLVTLDVTDNLGTTLKSVKEQLRAIPNKGIGYGLLRYLNLDPEIKFQLERIPEAEISFNYLGQVLNTTSSLMQLARESRGNSVSLQGQRSHLLDVNAIITDEELQISWTYSSNVHQHETIENIAQEFVETLREIIAHCLSPENGGYTPSDFPLAKLTQTQLDAELGKTNWQNVADIYPLSPMQQGMLFHSLYAPELGVYFTQLSWTLTGNLNVPAFEQAWQQVVARHTILRTAFIWESLSQPLQIVYEKVNITIQTDDWRKLSAQQQQQQLEVFVESERQQSFQLSQAPLMRLHLLQLDRNTYQFIWSHHHLLLDGWSLPLVFQDLLDLYQAICQSKSLPLQKTISYRNYIAWLQQQNIAQAKEFWQQKLQGFSVPTPLTVDKPLSNREQDSSYSEQQIQLTVAVTTAVESFARQHQLTLNNLVQASWALLLSRYSQETDVVFGATVSGRPPTLSGVESMVGLFINTLPVRVQISEKTQLLDLLKDLQTQQIESEQFSYSSLVDIQGLSDVPRGRSLFESIVVFENYPVDRAVSQDDDNLSISHVRGIEQTNYPLTFVAVPGKQLFLKVSYDTSRFEDGTISRMLGHLVTLLSAIVANPQERISQLPLLTATEQQQVIVEWNDTEVKYPQEQCIHQLFEKQVELNPQAVAVVFEDQQLTYQELNQRANQLGHHLRTLGVKPDVFVGICAERSLEMVVGLLGILKAGGAYLPLDPDYPQERLSFMLQDAQVSVLLTQQHLIENLPDHQAQLVCLDSDWHIISEYSQENSITDVQATNLAYVIYTSGSTGQPKGVMLSHRNLCNHMFWMQATFPLTETDKVLQKTPFSFDASVWEFYAPLLVGGQLLLAQPGGHADSYYLLQLIAQQKVTTVQFVPSLLRILLEQGGIETCDSLKQVFCGGEVLPVALQEGLLSKLNVNLHNLYGPTEACIDSTFWTCQRGSERQVVSIGRAIANAQVYILDEYLQPVPIGVPGELHIGGAGLARGYLNRPELTAEKFIRNPWSQDPDSRLYKTGDLARYLPNGNIEYLGRIDYQVKIRGFRIELGEIEASLSQHPDVLSVVVIAREDIPGDKRLIAYLVVNQQLTPNISQLRQFLMQKLPEYMIPSAFVYLDSLPLTPNGKVDRRNLPAPEFNRQLEVGYVAPRNPVEEMLAQIWADVLRVEQVGIHDNFFELGGDSILSIQIISRAKLAGVQLTVKQLFANQKIAQLSTVVGTTLALQIEQELVTGTLPLTPIQHWFFEQDLPEKHHFNQSLLLSVPSDIKPEILEQAWQQLLVHHDALRLRFKQTDLTWQQMHAAPTGVVFSFFNISTLREPELQAAIETTANTLQASLNLSENLVQVGFFFLGIDKEARLLIVIHHLVVDGVSWRILLEDLQTAYEQISQGKAIKLPPKTTSFKDWAQKLREYAQSEVLKSELGYWLSASESWVSPLPRLRQGVNSVASARTISVSLNQTETQALLQYVPKAYKTQINDVLLTALVLVVSRWTNSSSVIFNLEGHGREEIVDGVDLSRTIGWFTTIFPVLVTLDVTDNLGTTLKSVKEQLRAIPNKGIGYGLLRYLNLDPEIKFQLERIPEAEISFNYLGQVLNTTSSLMQLARESRGNSVSLQGQRSHLLDVNAIITDEELQISWTYSSNVHQHETIENIAQEFVETLREIIAHCLSPENGGYTPSDFPLAKLTQTQLDAELGKTNWQNVADIYPLSPMQQGMLFHSLYAPESGVYFTQLSWTLTGNLNVPAFEQAWQQVVARHTILRTAFIWESLSQPLQIVYEKVNITIQTDDWRKLSAQQQQQQLEVFVESERQQSFQLSQAPLMRLHLLQLDRNTYQFIWSHHHLLLDGWSLPLVFQDLLDLYQAICQSKSLPLQRTISYRNYIAWLQQQNIAQAKEFWQQKLQGFSVPTPLTVDKPLSNREQDSSYSEQQIQLTVAVTTAVESFARQHQLTLNNLVQASWALLLSRYSQETDVVFGATVSGRPPTLSGVESMVGLFINTLPVRVQISEKTQLLDLLKDLQTQQIESEQFSYSSLVDIQGLSDVPRGRSLFESIVVFENYPVDRAVSQDDNNLSISHVRGIEQTNYPLTFVAVPGKQLFLKVSYDTSRFEDGTISRMLGHLVTLLSAIVANPQERISQLPLLTATEQQQVIVEWNDTEVKYPQEQCIHQLFEKQVELNPQAVAVVFEDQQLTYQELNQRANQLGHHLRTLGVKPDVFVGICVERSLSMVVGLLGILKAGGAYVPLDPDYPQERLAYMLKDAQVSVLLTQQKLLAEFSDNSLQIVCLDCDWQIISQQQNTNLINKVNFKNLAYIIYTSGSTGKPKGVMAVHKGLLNLISWHQSAFGVTAQDRATQLAGTAFDASAWELWPYLSIGAAIYLVSPEIISSPVSLQNWLVSQKISITFVPTPLAEALLSLEWQPENLALRIMLTGGDKLHLYPSASIPFQLVNNYGPTENTVVTTSGLVVPNAEVSKLPNIGRVISNVQVYILDNNSQPVPIGVPGELHIGGAGLARGYLNRPELTAEKFIRNPWSQDPDSRLYKTGDLARYLPNGNIEYLGRIDYQVKIRGFRIELGEIEASLSQHPDVLSVVVIAREDIPGDKRLIAYLVVNQQLTPNISQLRQFLMQKLPEYMIPSAFVYLDSLPLTPNGKVDRRNLPAPEFNRQLEVGYVAPRNPVEEMLAQIWADVLRVEQVGIHDNFFSLGGHSLLATQLVSQVREVFSVELPLDYLFKNPTIAALSEIILTQLVEQSENNIIEQMLNIVD